MRLILNCSSVYDITSDTSVREASLDSPRHPASRFLLRFQKGDPDAPVVGRQYTVDVTEGVPAAASAEPAAAETQAAEIAGADAAG